MRLLFVCRKFDNVAGGVERSAITLMNALSRSGHTVELLTWDQAGAHAYYSMDEAIRWHRLDMGDPMRKADTILRLRRLWRIRAIVRASASDVVFGFQHGAFLAAHVSLLGLGIPVIALERNAPSRFDHLRAGRYRNLVFQSLRLATRVVVQMESYRRHYPDYLAERIVSIPNPVFDADCRARPAAGTGGKTLLAVGRLSYQKNFQALLRAFAGLAADFPDWTLRIVGDGEERRKIGALAGDLGLDGRVEFPGAVQDIARKYCAAHLFCLPSLWEGFPNALAEAMAHGLPAVAYRGCAGANELIRHEETGLLADGNGSSASLEACLRTLMQEPDMRTRFGAAARNITTLYAPERIVAQWEKLIRDVAGTP